MRLISIGVARRTLIRFVSSNAVRIALSATLTTPQPAVAFQAVNNTPAQQLAATLLAAAPADGNDSTAAPRDGQPPGFGGPGPGWG